MFPIFPKIYPISYFLFKYLPLVILGLLIFNLIHKKFQAGWGKKRFASFYFAIVVIILFGISLLIMRFKLSDILILPVLLGTGIILYLKKQIFFPYKFKCLNCKAKLPMQRIVFRDSNLCIKCENEEDKTNSH